MENSFARNVAYNDVGDVVSKALLLIAPLSQS